MKQCFFAINLLGFVLVTINGYGQDCNQPRVAAEFSLLGNDICEGNLITIQNTTLENGHKNIMYIMSWGDNKKDTIMQKTNMQHRYNLDQFNACAQGSVKMSLLLEAIVLGCEDKSHEVGKPVYVSFQPRPQIDVSPQICINASEVSIKNQTCPNQGVKYQWDFGDVNSPNNSDTLKNPAHKFSTPGNYTIQLVAKNNCGEKSISKSISVVSQPKADFAYSLNPQNGCLPNVIATFNNLSNQGDNTLWKITPAQKWQFIDTLMTLSSKNISLNFLQAGQYIVSLVADNICKNPSIKTETINIFAPPFINIESPGSFCDTKTITLADLKLNASGEITQYDWTFENGSQGNFTGKDFGSVTFTKSGRIRLNIQSPCGPKADTAQITIASTVPVTLDGNKSSFCQDENPSQLKAVPESGQWKIEGSNVVAIDAQGMFDPSKLNPGKYTLTYSAGSDQCPNEKSIDIEIKPKVTAELQQEKPACDKLSYTPLVTFQGEIDTYSWTFADGAPATATSRNPSAIQFNTPGQKLVTIEATGLCGMGRDTITIDIQQNAEASITGFTAPFCAGSAPDTLKVNLTGGEFSGTGISDKALGIFDPKMSGVGTFIITFTRQNGACTAMDTTKVTVVPSDLVNLSKDTFCIDASPRALSVDKSGGKFKGLPGVVDSITGVFNPSIAGVGNEEIRYLRVDGNNCAVETSAIILVEALPVLSLPDTLSLCVSSIDVELPNLLNFAPNPGGGKTTWTGTGIKDQTRGTFNAGTLTQGVFPIQVSYQRHDCSIADTVLIKLIQAQELQLSSDATVCIADRFLQLTANLQGGQWSGGPGIDPITGRIDLEMAGGGDFTYTYTFQKGTNCEQSKSVKVKIIDLSKEVNAGANVAICFGPTRYSLPKGSPANGFFRGPGLLDSLSGLIDLTLLRPDTTYVFQYCLNSAAVANCQACKSQTFRINSNPIADFDFDGIPCIDQKFKMINKSQRAVRYLWNFGDGATSMEFEPQHSYTQKGTYILTLIATSSEGCSDTLKRSLYITTPPIVDFTIPRREGCAPFVLTAQNRSSGDSITQYWIVGRDTIRGADLGAITLDGYTQDTTIKVILVVENLCGIVRRPDSVLVHPYPIVRFAISQDEGCSPSRVELFSASLGNPDNLLWDLGNGQSSTLPQPPAQVYTTSETAITEYSIMLKAWNQCGRDSMTKTLTVYPPNVKAFIERDTFSACQPFQYRPQGLVTPGAKLSWKILHPNGSMQSSELASPLFLLPDAGRYTLILYASNCGTDTDTAYLNVLPAPTVRFSHRPFVCVGQSIDFINNSPNISGSQWNFGDGSMPINTTSASYTYDSAGTYWVKLRVLSQLNNCPAEDSSQVLVIGNPKASFSANRTSGCFPLKVDFSNRSTGSGNLQSVWSFGDGSSSSTSPNPSHTFDRPGNYVVKLTVFDRDSCFADTSLLNIFVHDHPRSQFTFVAKNYCLRHDSLRLSNQSSGAIQYRWRFQRDTSRRENPVFWPQSAGVHPIELITLNEFNCADTLLKNVTILESPIAQIDPTPLQGCEDFALSFKNQSRFATGYRWTYDGNTSSANQPSHTFRNPGNYWVELAASATNGCPSDLDSIQVQVWPKPIADFRFQKPDECGTPATVIFTNQSQFAQGFSWQYGDGSSSTRNQDSHIYQAAGVYTVTLFAENEFACRDTVVKTVDIFGQPIADFEILTDDRCAPLTIRLGNNSTSARSYRWNISGIGTFTDTTLALEIKRPGTYTISLLAIYNERCKDSIQGTLRLYQKPKAEFTYRADLDPNLLGDVQFLNLSTNFDRVRWLFGDGNVSTANNPNHEYSINRQILVTLFAFNDNQGQYLCVDTIIKPVEPEWLSRFYAPNAMTPNYGDPRIQVFKPTGVGIKEYNIAVFSPQGQQVWYAEEKNQPVPTVAWDGSFRGEIVPQGAYAWKADVQFEDGTRRVYTGTVTVVR